MKRMYLVFILLFCMLAGITKATHPAAGALKPQNSRCPYQCFPDTKDQAILVPSLLI